MKSTFATALIMAGIALFGVLFVACGSEDAEETALSAPARPSAPAAQPAPAPDASVAETPSMIQQQAAPPQPAKAPQAPMPARAAAAATGNGPAPATRGGVDAMTMESSNSSNNEAKSETANKQDSEAADTYSSQENVRTIPVTEDVAKAVTDAIAAGMKNAQGATKEEVTKMVQSAVAAASAGQVTRGDVEQAVAKSVQEAASGGLTAGDVQKIVDAAVAKTTESALMATSAAVELSATTAESLSIREESTTVATAPAPAASASIPSRAASLTAGEVDDNHQWDEYLRYRRMFEGGVVHDLDVSERYTITVVDANDRPVPNALVRVSADNPIFEGLTYASGQTLFFPRAFPNTDDTQGFRLYVEKDGTSQNIDVGRGQTYEWVVKLDVNRAFGNNVPLDVLFLLDSTGSMSDEIDRIKDSLLSISASISDLPSRPDLRFGMVAYRDRGDEFITRVYDFDHDFHRFADTIREVHADGGGDEPESLNEALHVAVHKPSWRLGNAIRLVFLVADAPPHLDYPQDYDYSKEMVEAHRRGIKIFSIATSGLNDAGEYIFRQIAQHTMGRFIFILYGGNTPHQVSGYTVENLDDLVARLVEEELANLDERDLRQDDSVSDEVGMSRAKSSDPATAVRITSSQSSA